MSRPGEEGAAPEDPAASTPGVVVSLGAAAAAGAAAGAARRGAAWLHFAVLEGSFAAAAGSSPGPPKQGLLYLLETLKIQFQRAAVLGKTFRESADLDRNVII